MKPARRKPVTSIAIDPDLKKGVDYILAGESYQPSFSQWTEAQARAFIKKWEEHRGPLILVTLQEAQEIAKQESIVVRISRRKGPVVLIMETGAIGAAVRGGGGPTIAEADEQADDWRLERLPDFGTGDEEIKQRFLEFVKSGGAEPYMTAEDLK